MSDIVERLRFLGAGEPFRGALMCEAADEIERLRQLIGRWYRLRAQDGRRGVCLPLATIETPILERVAADLRSKRFMASLVEGLRQEEELGGRSAEVVREEIRRLEREKSRAAQLSLQGDDGGTFFGLVKERARQINARQRELEALQAARARRAVCRVPSARSRQRTAGPSLTATGCGCWTWMNAGPRWDFARITGCRPPRRWLSTCSATPSRLRW